MSNKYLEKIALNAQSARIMAKTVGIIPEHTSAWKYALRNLRDGKGAPLQGKALHEGRAKLGDVSNNTFQRMKSLHEHHGGTQDYEFATRVNRRGKINDTIIKGDAHGEIKPRGTLIEHGDNLHTHPSTSSTSKLNKLPHLHAEPSGKTHVHNTSSEWGKGSVSNIVNTFRDARTDFLQGDKLRKKLIGKGDYTKAMNVSSRMDPAIAHIDHVDKMIRSPKSFAKYDAGNLILRRMYKNDTHIERIVAPDHNVVSANKFRGDGIRTVYFDHTPRKAK